MSSQNINQFSDMYLFEQQISQSVVFPGPSPLPETMHEDAALLLQRCQHSSKDDFTVAYQQTSWQVRRDRHAIDGLWYRLRRLADKAPTLTDLPAPLSGKIVSMLLSPHLLQGGLVYITGAAGAGKTTTASATVVSRLQQFGGVCYTIEDPPELPLNGWHGQGFCSQTEVAGELANDWAESFRCALRSQPTATRQILFVGEVRHRESAQMMLRAAANGFLVIATGFGTDLPSAVDALLKLTGDQGSDLVANLLRLVIYQRLQNGIMTASVLASTDAHSPVAAKLRSGNTLQLRGDMDIQAQQLLRGISPLEAGHAD